MIAIIDLISSMSKQYHHMRISCENKNIDELILPRRKTQFRKTYGWRNICFSLSCLQPERVRGTQKTYSFDVFVANKKCISKVTVILEVKYH